MRTTDRRTAQQEVQRAWRTLIPQITKPARTRVNDETSWICPLCGHGTHGDGLTVNPRSKSGNGLKCFGCSFSGDIISLYMQHKNIRYQEALTVLAGYLGLEIIQDRPSILAPKNAPPAAQPQQETREMQDFTEYYRQCCENLRHSEEAISYLTSRGISLATADACWIGFDPAADPAGAPGGDGTHRYPCPRLILPVTESFYIGRSTDPRTAPSRVKMNPKGSTAAIFGAGGLNLDFLHCDTIYEVFITEGFFDALSIMEASGAAIALNSTSNYRLLIKILDENPTDAILILCLDNDAAGQKATEELKAELQKRNIPHIDAAAEVCLGYKDPNEALVRNRNNFIETVQKIPQKIAQPDDVYAYICNSMDKDAEKLANQEVKTGYWNLDEKSGGLRAGLYVLAAISSLGKTTFLLQMADQIAAGGNHVLFFSLEQSRLELVSKAIARRTAQNDMAHAVTSTAVQRIRSKRPAQALEAARQYGESVRGRLSIIEGNFNCDIDYIGSYVHQYIKRNHARPVVIVDYLQILQPSSQERGRQSSKEIMDNTVTALKRLSREYGITIIAISSVNRGNYLLPVDFESLKESGSIEYSADVIWGLQLRCLNADPVFERSNNIKEKRQAIREAKAATPREIELVCLKNRYGISSFSCYFNYYPAYDLFEPVYEIDKDSGDGKFAPTKATSQSVQVYDPKKHRRS